MRNIPSIILFLYFTSVLFSCQPSKEASQPVYQLNDTVTSFNPSLPDQPNIVWLVAEDLSAYLPSFGDSTITTPNLSRLAAQSVRYPNVFSPSGVCAPSRFALATGMYPSSLGGHNMRTQYVKAHMDSLGLKLYEVVTPPEVKMMSELMRTNGYYCTNNDKTDYQFAPVITAWDENGNLAHWRNRPDNQPFFSVFNLDVTHESQVFHPTSVKNLRYNENFPDSSYTYTYSDWIPDSLWTLEVPADLKVPVPPYLPNTELVRNDIRRVYSNIKIMDRQVGLILDQLEEDGLLDNTIIVFYTDHGGPLPRQKRLMYDSGIKVPMMICYPGQRGAGIVDDQLISFIDFAPTAFSMAGFDAPEYIQGQAFVGPYKADQNRKYIHAAADRLDTEIDMIRAVRDNRFKYLKNFQPDRGYYLEVTFREQMNSMQELLRMRDEGTLNEVQMQWFRESKPEEELFDTWNDPHEINNIANDPKYASKLSELREECQRWMADIHDMGKIPEKDILSSFWPDWQQPVTSAPSIEEDNNQIVVSCETEGSSIGYQWVSPEQQPLNKWKVYTEPIPVQEDKQLIVLADRIGFMKSDTVSWH